MNLSIFQQTKPVTGSNVLVMAIYKNSAPAILIDHFPVPGPYVGGTALHTFSGLQNIVYNYKLFESPDGSATGTLRNAFDVQPNQNAYNTRDDLYLVADISSSFPSGGTTYGPDASLIGWNWGLERIAQGTQQINVKYVKTKAGVDTTQDDLDADGWRTAISGDLIGPNEEWCIHFLPQLAATSSSSVALSPFSAINILTTNTTLDNSCIGQCFWLMGGGGFFEVQLPDLATVPDNEPVYFKSNGGVHVNVSIKAFPGQQLQWFRNSANLSSNLYESRIVLGQIEEVALCKVTLPDGSKRWLPLSPLEGAKAVGEFVSSPSKIGLNYLFMDGTQGLSKTTYARAWDFINDLDPSCRVPAAAWNATTVIDNVTYFTNHGKFTDGGSTFGVPMLFENGFMRAVSGSGRSPLSFEVLQQLAHTHDTSTGSMPGQPNGIGGLGTKGGYNGTATRHSDLTSQQYNIPGANTQGFQLTRIGGENRPSNFGIYISMKI